MVLHFEFESRAIFLPQWYNNSGLHTLLKKSIRAMKRLSHLLVAIATLMLLVFGSGGIGWQRCSCSGKTSLVHPIQKGCCSSGSSCMKVSFSQVSTADLQQETTVVAPTIAEYLLPIHLYDPIEWMPSATAHRCAWLHDWMPPGWVSEFGMVMLV